MRILFKILSIGFFIASVFKLQASHLWGGEMSYQITAKNKLVVSVVAYRDCKGIAMSASNFTAGYHAGVNGGKACSTVKVNLTRISIKDVTPVCDGSKPCNPLNTYNTGDGIEAHYMVFDTLDLNSAPLRTFIKGGSCCEITFYISTVGRSNSITTGQSATEFYLPLTINFCNLYRCKDTFSKGPTWSDLKNPWACCNQGSFINTSASDKDGDGLKYRLSPALSSHNTAASYSSPYSYLYPASCYCTPQTSYKCAPNTSTNPPRGQFLDSNQGIFTYTAVKCDEVAVLALKCEESRLDSLGKSLIISTTYREILLIAKDDCGYNKSPTLTGIPSSARVCSGDKLQIPFTITDEIFTPYQTKPDTPSVFYSGNFAGAKIIYRDSTSRNKEGIFSWNSLNDLKTISKTQLQVTGTDNHCPKPAFTIKTASISVFPKITDTIQLNIQSDSCGGITAFILNDSIFKGKNYEFDWEIYNTDSSRFYLKTTSTLPFLKLSPIPKGNYTIAVSGYNSQNCVKQTPSKSFFTQGFSGSVLLGKDTAYCINSTINIGPEISGMKQPYKFKWEYTILSPSPKNVTDTNARLKLLQPTHNIQVKNLQVTDNNNCVVSSKTGFNILAKTTPTVKLGNDTTICENAILQLQVPIYLGEKYKWNTGDTIYTIWVQNAGSYSLKTTHVSGCSAADTIEIKESKIPIISTLNPGTFCGLRDSLNLDSFILVNGVHPAKNQLTYTPKSVNGDSVSTTFKNYNLSNGSVFTPNAPFGLWKIGYSFPVDFCPDQKGIYTLQHRDIPKLDFSVQNMEFQGNSIDVSFRNNSTVMDPEGLTFAWDFPGGNPDKSTLNAPKITYPASLQSYVITLKASTPYCSIEDTLQMHLSENSLTTWPKGVQLTPDLRITGWDGAVVVRLFDGSGRLLAQRMQNEGIAEIQLPAGMYFYSITLIQAQETHIQKGKVILPLIVR